ncbi:MAG: glycosyltransferase [Candidatus Micrarchaeota archaeon]
MVKMDITIISHYLDEGVGHGIARYSVNLVKELMKKGITVRTINSFRWGKSRLKSAFDFFFFVPLKILLLPTKSCVYHLTAPQMGFVIPLFKKIYKKRIVTTIYDLHPILYFDNSLSSRMIKHSIKTAIISSDLLLSISSQTKEDIIENFGIPEDKIIVTPLGVSDRFRKLKIKKKEFTIGYVGGFAGNKDVPFLLRAYAIFEKQNKIKAQLILYGTGAHYNPCMELAKELGIKNVEFRGFAKDDDLVRIYNSFDVFVFPSTLEGFGLPIIEAQKCQTPVIVRKNARIPSEVTKFCMLVSDEQDLAKTLEKNYHNKFTFTAEHKKHIAHFTWKNCVEKTLETYKIS